MWMDSSAWTEHNQGPWDPQNIGGQTAGLNTNQYLSSTIAVGAVIAAAKRTKSAVLLDRNRNVKKFPGVKKGQAVTRGSQVNDFSYMLMPVQYTLKL